MTKDRESPSTNARPGPQIPNSGAGLSRRQFLSPFVSIHPPTLSPNIAFACGHTAVDVCYLLHVARSVCLESALSGGSLSATGRPATAPAGRHPQQLYHVNQECPGQMERERASTREGGPEPDRRRRDASAGRRGDLRPVRAPVHEHGRTGTTGDDTARLRIRVRRWQRALGRGPRPAAGCGAGRRPSAASN